MWASVFDEFSDVDISAAAGSLFEPLAMDWVSSALQEVGVATIRRRKLPVEQVVWLVAAMSLFSDRSLQEVVAHLGLALPSSKGKRGGAVAPSSVVRARERLGCEAVQLLCDQAGRAWDDQHAEDNLWHGLRSYAVDGSTLRAPDTEDVMAVFGEGPKHGAADSYPLVRVLMLFGIQTHLVRAARFGPGRGKGTAEIALFESMLDEIPDHSVTVADKFFNAFGLFYRIHHGRSGQQPVERHFVVQAKKNARFTVVRELGHGDAVVELGMTPQARKKDPGLPARIQVRAISYCIGDKQRRLFTSLLDPERYPAVDIIELYGMRWEVELGYGELKQDLLQGTPVLRSRKADGVHQEVWGIFIAFNLVRLQMLRVAKKAGVAANRVSFRHSIHLVRIFCVVHIWATAPSKIPTRLDELTEMLSLLLLPPKRRGRSFPRALKRPKSPYPNKKKAAKER